MNRIQDIVNQVTEKPEILISGGIGIGIGLIAGVVLKQKIKKVASSIGILPKNAFAGINRPTAGARTQKELKRGDHSIQLYSLGTPNGQKVTILLEELGLKYDAHVISLSGDQFGSGFVAVNPNSKIPALVDYREDDQKGLNVFESGNILLHLAEKEGKFIPTDSAQRTECLNLLFFQMGACPIFGQYGHFTKYCPKGFWFDHDYAHDRYKMEVQRICSVLDGILKDRTYLVGDEYTIADIAWFPWVQCLDWGYSSWEKLEMEKYTNLVRWCNLIKERKAVVKGMKINQPWNKEGYGDYSSEK